MSWWDEYRNRHDEIKKTCELLDTIDILKYLKNGTYIEDVMTAIEEDYDYPLNYEPFDGFIFNWMDEYEFANYCYDRYGTSWGEVTRTYVINPGGSKDDTNT